MKKILVLSEQNNIPISFVTNVINEILKITNTHDEVAINFVKQSYFYKSIINPSKSKFNDYDLKQKRTLAKETQNNELLTLLSSENDVELLQSLVTNPATPTLILDNIIKLNEQNHNVIEALVTNSYNLTEELLNKILENNNFKQNKEILLNIAQNPTTTDFIFKKLLSLEIEKYDYDLLKRYIAQNNNANNDLLTFIVKTNLQNEYIKFDVAKNSNTSDELLSKLIFNNLDYYHLILKALQNNNLSEQTAIKFINQLENLNKNEITDLKSDYLFAIAENKNSSTKLLDILLNNKYSDLSIRRVIASHKNASIATLKKLSYDKSEIVREQVVNNDNATIDILHKLSYDNDFYIKNIAKEKKRIKKKHN